MWPMKVQSIEVNKKCLLCCTAIEVSQFSPICPQLITSIFFSCLMRCNHCFASIHLERKLDSRRKAWKLENHTITTSYVRALVTAKIRRKADMEYITKLTWSVSGCSWLTGWSLIIADLSYRHILYSSIQYWEYPNLPYRVWITFQLMTGWSPLISLQSSDDDRSLTKSKVQGT